MFYGLFTPGSLNVVRQVTTKENPTNTYSITFDITLTLLSLADCENCHSLL